MNKVSICKILLQKSLKSHAAHIKRCFVSVCLSFLRCYENVYSVSPKERQQKEKRKCISLSHEIFDPIRRRTGGVIECFGGSATA